MINSQHSKTNNINLSQNWYIIWHYQNLYDSLQYLNEMKILALPEFV